MKQRAAALGAALFVGLGLGVHWCRSKSTPGEDDLTDTAPRPSAQLLEATRGLESLIEPTREEFDRAARLSESQVVESVPTGGLPGGDTSTSGEVEWPRDLPRTSFDLVRYGVKNMEYLETRLFVRHETLNPHDIPVSEEAAAELDAVVQAINRALHDLNQAYDSIRVLEMIDQIDAGLIPPREEPEDDARPRWVPSALRERAARAARERGTTVEEEIESLGLQHGSSHGESTIFHNSAAYRHTAFESLPATEAALQTVNYFAYESMITIGSWFVARGLVPDQELVEALGSAPLPTVSELMKRIPHRSR